MVFLIGFVTVGVILLIAAIFVGREATRLATQPPPPTYSLDEAYEWVVQHVSDDVAATLTPDDVKRIIGFQLEYFKRRGGAVNGSRPNLEAPVIVGGAETVAYILERAEATGEAFTFVSPEEEGDLKQIERAIKKTLPRVTVPDFDYSAKPQTKLEVPLAERIAEIRKKKAEDRARAAAKVERRSAAQAGGARPAAPSGGRSAAPARKTSESRGPSTGSRGPSAGGSGGAGGGASKSGAAGRVRRGPHRGQGGSGGGGTSGGSSRGGGDSPYA